ncbi:MAG: hypothetical protein FJ276_06645, partial [Planctomycetes bacterium]|nr:hypothetical protein [Planctomycetota bacterium]
MPHSRIQARDDAGNAYQGAFQVAEHRADTAIASIDLPKNVSYRGEDITGTIRVAYRYGLPAVGQLVHYQLMNDREFTARTNERGEVPLALSTRNYYADQVVVLTVKLPALEIERTQEISFAVNGFGVDVSTPRDVFLANEAFDVTLAARDAEGKPVSQPLNLEVYRLTKVGDTEVEQAVQGHAVNTGEPDGVARKTLQLAATGRYRLRVSGEDRRGNQIGEHHDVQISGEDDPTRLRILLDDRVWRVGDRAEVVLHWREKPALALMTFQADQVWDYRLVPLQTGPNLLQVDLDKRLAPRFQLKAVVMLDSRTEPGRTPADATPAATSSLRLHIAEVALDVTDALRVALSYPGQGQERNVVKPGQPVEVTVRTTDSQGRPVPAEISLALLEVGARNQLSETPIAGMSEFFRPETRPLSVRSGSSIEFKYPPATLPVNQPQSAGGARGIDPRMGTVPGVFPTNTPPPATQTWPGMPPGTAKPASGTWEAAGTSAIAPRSSDTKQSQSGHRERQAVPRSTAYWSAVVATDDTGVATVTVNVPRHLATWQLVAKGITRESVAGETVETIVSEQALFGELKVPATLVPGDETEVVAVVHNLRNEPASVEARLAMSFAGQTVEQTRNATVDARGRQELRFPLAGPVSDSAVAPGASPVVGAQLASIRLTLMQGDVADTVEQVIPWQSRAIATYSTIRGMADSNRSVTVASPAGSTRGSLRLRVRLRTSMEECLWDAVMTPRIGVGHESEMATTDSLSSDVLSAVGIQQLLQLSAATEELRARQLAARIRTLIAELISAQHDGGAWGWSLGSKASDRYATARVVWALSVARQAGHHVPDDCLRKATQYLTGQLADTAPDDRESKAILLHALSAAGQADFSLGNRLYRERAQLSTPALLYLALAFIEMDRGPIAAELLGICEQRANDMASGTVPAPPAPSASQAASAEWLALRALALTRVAPEADSTGAAIEQVLVQRQGLRWTPDRVTGPAVLALCRWFDHHRQPSPNRTFKVSVNDRPAQVSELPAGPGEFEIDVPANELADGDQRVAIEPAGPGRYLFDVVLSSVSIAEPSQSTTQAWRVARTYSPAPREQSGRPLQRGFAIVRDTSRAFVNPLTQLPVGQRGEVELQVMRAVPDDTPAEMLDYLVVTEPIPSGVTVLPESIIGPHEHVEWSPGKLTFYLGKTRTFTPIRYEVVGHFAGESQAGATVAWNAYRPEERVVAEPKRLRVLPPGAVSADPYRWTPHELFELGKLAYQQRDWPRAELLLSQLLDEWSLKPGPYRDTVDMLLDAAIELQKSDRVVRYFEIVFEQWPDQVFVLDKVVRIGAAYQELGEAERSYQVFRAAVEGAFTREAGVAGVLLGMGKRLPSVRVVQRLLCEYPPEPYVASAHLALAQQIATWASEDTQEAQRPEVGVQPSDLLTAAWRMQEDYLVEYPLAPNADQAAFSAANALLELKDFARAAAASQRSAVRYPDSELLDDFWFMAGYCRFMLGEFEPAIEMMRNVTSGKFLDKSSGQLGESDNKWSA